MAVPQPTITDLLRHLLGLAPRRRPVLLPVPVRAPRRRPS